MAGPRDLSRNVAHCHAWHFNVVNSLTQFKGTVDVLVWSIYTWGWCLRFFRECRLSARLMFQHLFQRHCWCFGKVNIYLRLKFEVSHGMSLVSTLDVLAWELVWHGQWIPGKKGLSVMDVRSFKKVQFRADLEALEFYAHLGETC